MRVFKFITGAIVIFTLAITSQASPANVAGEIVTVYGKVRLQRGGKLYRVKAGVRLYGGDVLTGRTESSKAVLFLKEGSTVTLTGKFQFVIDRVEKKESRWHSMFRFFMGKARFVVSKIYRKLTGSYFEIKTPTAVTGVRGTEFALIVSSTGATDVFIFEGEVFVKSGEGVEKILSAGKFARVNEMGRIEQVGEVKEDVKKKLYEELSPEVEEDVMEEGEGEGETRGEEEQQTTEEIRSEGEEMKEGAGEEFAPGGGNLEGNIPPVKLDPEELKGRIKFRFR